MGIPYYFYVLIKTYPNIIRTAAPAGCTDLCVDFNGAIHHAANLVLQDPPLSVDATSDAVLDRTWSYLMDCVNVVRPSGTVQICTDGVAPIAKMYQQRKRRYMSIWKQMRSGGGDQVTGWDRNAISPGTPFMNKLQAFMAQKIRDRDMSAADVHFYFSGADEAGEGEHKIFARIPTMGPEHRIIVHGLDADLIMLSLMSHHPNIHLMREPTGAYKDMETNEGFIYLDVDKLRHAILRDLKTHFNWPVTADDLADAYSTHAREIIETYVTVCSILGNDFLPHPVTLPLKAHGYNALLTAARHAWDKHGALIADGGQLCLPFLTEVFKQLADTEDTDLWKLNEDYLKRRPFEREDDPMDCYPLKHKDPLVASIYEGNPNKWRQLYYKHLFHTRMHDTTVIATACRLFTQGITWVYRYYKRLPKDAEWYYPYNYAPSLRDMANFMMSLTPPEVAHLTARFTTPPGKGFVHPWVQLLCIMPRASSSILPKKVAAIMNDPSCAHMFPTDFGIQTYMKMHLWECTPVLPMLDVNLFCGILKET